MMLACAEVCAGRVAWLCVGRPGRKFEGGAVRPVVRARRSLHENEGGPRQAVEARQA